MSLLRRRDRSPTPGEKRHWGRLAARWIVPIVGGITPVLLIAINVAAFMVKHLDQFRWTIAVLAFLSGMMLNTYLALKIYRFLQRRISAIPQVNEANEEYVIVIGMGVILAVSFVLAWLTYRQLDDPAHLPDAFTFWWGFLQIALPFGIKMFNDLDRRGGLRLGRRRTPTGTGDGVRGQPTPAPPPPPTQAGYTPPPWLPPS